MIKYYLIFAIYLTWSSIQGFAGQNFYIAPNGSNTNVGSINSPWRSLNFALHRVRAGDTVILRGGFYNLGEVIIDGRKGMGGRPGMYLTIKAFPGEEPILRGSRRFMVHANFVRVEGLHFIMPWRLEAFGRGIQIINNKFTGPQPKFGAIETGGANILIEGNFIQFHNKGGNTRDHGIYVHKGEHIIIKNNTIIGTKGYGIHIFDEHKSANPNSWSAHPFMIKDYLIEGNFVANSQERSGMIIGKGRGGNFITLENITVRNNVFVKNNEFGLLIREGKNIKVYNNTFYLNKIASILIRYPSKGLDPASHVTIKNNIFVSNGRGHVGNTSPGQEIILENNLYDEKPRLKDIVDSHPIVGDPLFVDVENSNFHLKASSPAIDAGVYVGIKFKGKAPDLGAFEYDPINKKKEPLAFSNNSFPDSSSLAADIKSFRAFLVNQSVILNWKISSNQDFLGFEVQRGGDVNNLSTIAIVKKNIDHSTSKSYHYLDEKVAPGIYFYRLKKLTPNGTYSFSSTIKVEVH